MTGSSKKKLLIGIASTIGLVLLAEVALRCAGFAHPPAEVPIVIWNPTEDKLMEEGDYLFRIDPHALWSLRPGAHIQFGEQEKIDGPPEYVNADGFRGPRVPLAKTPGVLRIATLGDSCTFGIAAHDSETWSAVLARRLSEHGTRAEVLNGGVDGYTVRQGLEHYRHDVRPYHPDVVIAAFGVVNEHWSADETDALKIERLQEKDSALARSSRWLRSESRIVQGLAYMTNPRAGERMLAEIDKKRRIQQYLAVHARELDWPFDRRVGVDEFKDVYAELKREVEKDGARLIVIAMPRRPEAEDQFPVLRAYTRAVFQFARAQNVQVLVAHARFRYAQTKGLMKPDWMIHDFWHPSATGHAKIAEWLEPMVLDPKLHVGVDEEVDQLK